MRDRTPLHRNRRSALTTLCAAAAVLGLGLSSCASDDAGGAAEGSDTEVTGEVKGEVTDVSLVPATTTIPPVIEVPEVQVPDSVPTELVITDLIPGTGRAAEEGDLVIVDYVGVRTEDGAMFDNSYERRQPFDLVLGSNTVIRGWETGLIGVQVGTRRQLDIPAELAYGDAPPGGSVIRAGDALTFLVDVRAVVGITDAADAPLELVERAVIGGTEITLDDVVLGPGAELLEGQTALVNVLLARGTDGELLYNSWEGGYPEPIVLDRFQTLEALVEGLLGMRVGGVRVVSVPAALAFGEEGNTQIGLPAGADVIMVLELVGAF